MPTISANKRLRTLASELLGESDGEDGGFHLGMQQGYLCSYCGLNRKADNTESLEVQGLRGQIQKLQSQRSALESTLNNLREKLAQVSMQLFETQKFLVPLGGEPGIQNLPSDSKSWIQNIQHLLELPRTQQFLEQWEAFGRKSEIAVYVCKQNSMTASRILKHCEWVVCNLSKKHPAVYKIGITENVMERWIGRPYSYKFDPYDDWEQMIVLYVGADSMQCALVEAHLIHRFLGRSGCRNVTPGGESAKTGSGPSFTYVVWKSLAPRNRK